MNDQSKGLILTAIGVLAVIPDSLVVRLVATDALTFIFVRSALAAVSILVIVLIINRSSTVSAFRSMGRAGLHYAFFMAIATFCFISALQYTSIANALFIASTSPVFAAIASRVFLNEMISKRMVWTTIFALVGIGIIALGSTNVQQASFVGDLYALGAAAALAFSFTTARAAKHVSMVPTTALAYLAIAIVCWPFANTTSLSTQDWTYMIVLACFFIPIGTSLMALGPRYITAPEVSLLLLLEAILAPLLVWYVLGEDPGKWALVGGALVLGALFVSNVIGLTEKRRRARS